MAGAFRLLGKKRKLIFWGHALWTRLRREGSEGSKGSEGSVDGASPRGFLRFLSLTAFQAEGCGIALTGDEYEVSVMREGS